MMKRPGRVTATLGIAIALALPTAAAAHGATGEDPRGVGLHVGDAYQSCYFDLHPELTEGDFQTFAAEAGQMARFRQMSSADTLGAGSFDLSLGYAYFFLDDTKGAWNDTMSHPEADHYLGQQLGLPLLAVRVGVTDRVDTELYGTLNPDSNYGLVGVASKIRVLQQSEGMPVSVAVRPSVSALLGPAEVQVWNLAGDLSVSRSFHGLSPFLGVSLASTLAVDASADTEVGNQVAFRPVGFAGLDYSWRFLSVGAQAELSDLPALGLRVGGRF